MPSAVDWSEFSVWCFAPKDVQKINSILSRLREEMPTISSASQTQGDSLRALTASSVVACAACAKRWVGERLPGHSRGSGLIKSPRHHTSAVKYVYAQFAAGAIGR